MCEPIDDLYLHNIQLGCVHEWKAHAWQVNKGSYGGQQNGTIVMLVDRWIVSIDLEHTEASFSPNLIDLLCHSDASLACYTPQSEGKRGLVTTSCSGVRIWSRPIRFEI